MLVTTKGMRLQSNKSIYIKLRKLRVELLNHSFRDITQNIKIFQIHN